MSAELNQLADRYRLRLPDELHALARALPSGADLGTVRLYAPAEIGSGPRPPHLSPALLPIAEGEGGREVFALFVPPETGARIEVVCVASLETGVHAPVASSLRGFGAWLLLVRRAQAGLPSGMGLAIEEVLEESAGAAFALARALGLDALQARPVEPDALAIAEALTEFDRGSPWACSLLARHAPSPREALRTLAPAMVAAPFSAGLLEQAGDLLLSAQDPKRAVRSIAGALARLEPNLQAAPWRIEEADPDTDAVLEPFAPGAAFRFLQEHAADVPREFRLTAQWIWLQQLLAQRQGCALAMPEPAAVIDAARRRGLGGDLPGGRWMLHLAFGESLATPKARAEIAAELARCWTLAGSTWYAERFAAIAAA